MGLRPAKCYRRLKRAYCRTANKVVRKNFIGATPGLKVRQFNMGNPERDFTNVVDLIAEDDILIRDNAIEAARIAVTKELTKRLKKEGFFLKIRIYPFHILRENKLAQGAGADRVSTGMSHCFGKPIGRSARVKKGKVLFSVLVDEKDLTAAKDALDKTRSRFPCEMTIKIHTDTGSIGTKPRSVRMAQVEAEAAKEAEAAAAAEEKKEGEKGKEAKGEAKKEGEKGKEAKVEGKEAKAEGKKEEKKPEKKK